MRQRPAPPRRHRSAPVRRLPHRHPRRNPQGLRPQRPHRFVTTRGPHHLQLRVHERVVGETRACGTGACVAVAAARAHQPHPPIAVHYTADLPGGRLHIAVRPDGAIDLTGPAVVTVQGTVRLTPSGSAGHPAGADVRARERSGGSGTDLFRRSGVEHAEG
ncbi:hypothetical protein [Streptomyces sp. NEAU-174]|uniref:hypothetical protein n=1 Tax=Streptomyces sp. NEAU-174 TaxID=3458254 RepID=UPI004044736F